MAINLPAEVSSVNDLTGLILEVREYTKWFNQYTNAGRAHTTYRTPQPELSPITSTMIREWATGSPLTSARLDELTNELERIKAHTPVLTITLAAPVTHEVKEILVNWCRTNLNSDILVTFRFNANLLGGMVVRSGSTIHDWSFRRAILNNRHKFAEILNHV
ncbi:hypothetical protein EOL96_00910 [Candidatus Saccharibacteria bacterium]|nr:hypothetical protein [Candidatus Saccharibacteria bacterium]